MKDMAVQVEDLGKLYRIGVPDRQPETLREATIALAGAPFAYLRRMLTPPTEEETLWALRHVSFQVERGEVIGIIGRNGAGKSTLLKVLTRITDPTEGRAILKGRVGALLEVGTGFHPELTGRENVYLNGAILGMKGQETKRLFDEIVAFSGVEKFIDTPVKRYSSGMYVRLAFAVAAHLNTEILIVDEVLAVGDAGYRARCLEKMRSIGKEGRTIVFVSHDTKAMASLCTRAILMDDGGITADGPTDDLLPEYLNQVMDEEEHTEPVLEFPDDLSKVAQITNVRITDGRGHPIVRHEVRDPITIEFEFVVRQDHPNLAATCQVRTKVGDLLFITADNDWATYNHTDSGARTVPKRAGRYRAQFTLPAPLLARGRYELTLNLLYPMVELVDEIKGIFIEMVDAGTFAGARQAPLMVPIEWHVSQQALPAAALELRPL